MKNFLKSKTHAPELDSSDEEEIEAWVTHELTTGDKTITKKEAKGAIAAFAKKKGYKIKPEEWEALNAAFDAADTNKDGELDLAEVEKAVEGMELKMPKKFFKKYIKTFLKTQESPEEEIEAWATHELTTGDKTITKDEAAEFLAKFAKKHGYKMTKADWEEAEKMFDDADTNHDGELDLDEVVTACGGSEIKLPYKTLFKKFLKTKDEPEMSKEEEDEVKAWAEAELADGGTITGEEAVKFFGSYAKKHDYKMTPMDWGYLGYIFGQADTNSDGELDAKEVAAAMAEDE